MQKKSEENVRTAFAGESQAHMRYQIFSEKAEKEGLQNLSRLFRAVSYAEKVHATSHFKVLGGIKTDSENLQESMGVEHHEVVEMYPTFINTAKQEGEKGAERTMTWALEAEKIHESMFAKAKKAVDEKRDPALGPIQVCSVCGYTAEGEAPDKCPLCGAKKDMFRKF